MVSGALNNLLAFFASAFGPSPGKRGASQAAIAPTVSECFAPMASVNLSDASRVAADLDDVIALDKHRAYWPGYAPSERSNVITLKWNATAPRFKPEYPSEKAQGERCCSAFGQDYARAGYYLSDEAGAMCGKRHLKPIKTATPEEGLDLLTAHLKSEEDTARITEIAHQGHLMQLTQEVMNHQCLEGRYCFSQKENSTRHEVIVNGGSVVTVRSFVEFELVDVKEEGRLLEGASVVAVINTRVGVVGGKLDHEALGGEMSNMAFEIRYEQAKLDVGGVETLRRQEPDKIIMPV